jgi:hypothetical protein
MAGKFIDGACVLRSIGNRTAYGGKSKGSAFRGMKPLRRCQQHPGTDHAAALAGNARPG